MSHARDNTTAVPRLHVITPDRADTSAVARTAALVDAGAPLVQVRLKHATDRRCLEVVTELLGSRRSPDQRVLVDDRLDVALAAGAHGVHLGDDDLPIALARRLAGPDLLVGATARDPEAAKRAVDAGADYLGVGPVARSRTKTSGLPDPIGAAGVAAVAAAVGVPVVAIAGIAPDDVPDLLDAGAHGVAVSAAVYEAADPVGALERFLDALAAGTPTPTEVSAP